MKLSPYIKITLMVSGLFMAILFYSTSCHHQLTSTVASEGMIDYNFHIRPILSDRCFKCHGPDAQNREAGLRLDNAESAYAELPETPDAFAIIPRDLKGSEVYQRIVSTDTSLMMPPPESRLSLTQREKDLISRWIAQGAEYKRHWAFIKPQKTTLPLPDDPWPYNPIDHYTLARMEEYGLHPNPEATKEALLKRWYLDIIGLPPSIEAQEAFIEDTSPDAYEKVVDRLLDDRHYGEKMAIGWLDLARYADSHGYQDDGLRTMWPWRDWVIHAFNENYPYDKFLTWQLAGDLLPDANKETLLATGFNRNHKITQEGGVIDEEYRIEYVTDRTNTFGKGILALTFECAKCHDHKYDPISQKDYYRTFTFFNQVPERGIYGTIDASFADPPNMEITQEDITSILNFVNKKDSTKLEVMVMQDSSSFRPTYVLKRGVYDAKSIPVSFGLPESIMPYDTSRYAPNRLGLVQWLLDPNHPLTARVYVNRVWQQIFGRGIVKTTGDFGMQGELPTHPHLLDWLAVDFIEHGWDIKRLIKQIVLSSTYRQSAQIRKDQLATDPDNIYLSRSTRVRLSAEVVRDLILYSSGLLNEEVGGQSVKPYQPNGIWAAATSGRGLLMSYIQDHRENLYRRGLYTFIKRTVPPPSMLIFDGSNRDQCEVERIRTNTPLQALVMMNDPTVLEAARVLSERLTEQHLDNTIEIAFRKILARLPHPKELLTLQSYYQSELQSYNDNEVDACDLLSIGEYPDNIGVNTIEKAALMKCILLMYNMEETIVKI